jgi:molybdenum cofactor cytidylyltransferase
MQLTTLPIEQAIGHILRHNLADPAGRKALSKGRCLRSEDLATLRELGIHQVRVAMLEDRDVHEDEAAQRLAIAIAGNGVQISAVSHSRVNLLAEYDAVVEVHEQALLQINAVDGLTVATRRSHSLVRSAERVATIKIIPFAVPAADLAYAEQITGTEGPIVWLRRLRMARVGVLLVGSVAAQPRIERGVLSAITDRVETLGSLVVAVQFVAADEEAIAKGIQSLVSNGIDLLITAGETSIMDRDDVIPVGIRMAGGRIEHYGAPVEPGNLLLLAYHGTLPVLGAPGCVRSRDVNIVDLLLPRLIAGEHVRKQDIVALGHGGLLG